MGGRLNSLLPSDVVRPGAFARRSLPASTRLQGKLYEPIYGTSRELKAIAGFRTKCALRLASGDSNREFD